MTTTAATRWPPPPGLLLTPPGVYAPQRDTELLTRALYREDIDPTTDVLDLGTGSGVIALQAARLGARVTAVDISWPAVLTARLNAMLAGCRLRVRHGDLTAAVTGQAYDLVVSNPPYVPSPASRLPWRGRARAWEAGQDGRAFVDRICDAAPALLRPRGVLLIVHSALCDTEATLRRLAGTGLRASVTDHAWVPYGPVLRSRQAWLVRRGLGAEGADREELVVIRAERP
ncbi:HemK2/MTQ2 family protein methyltransferase [Streptomyces sp. V3I7]|uniref:HemK2/MTQ2 family protein methyltransferase n=1 Tax=Streptomyces sp. V3I7 TaxID=3042278 RepID=UPI00277F31DE|nr:HemK2/MTQ2 family protein methyltransferase [Streptomyces sp. V3I7]MDQ0994402.1 release factor glutamine methyltransferase [Streptomyces sp. V3I7]